MYVGIGTNEDAKDPQISTDVVKLVQELETDLRKKGMGPARLKVVVEEGGEHTEAAWVQALARGDAFPLWAVSRRQNNPLR